MVLIIMIIPHEKLTINTSLHTTEALQKLQAVIEPKRTIRWGYSKHKPYEGVIEGLHFTVSRILGYRNSFLPIIQGEIKPELNGCSIHISMSLHSWVKVFMVVWLGFVFLACLLSLSLFFGFATQYGGQTPNPPVLILIPFGMFVLGYGLMVGGFKYEVAKSKVFFSDLFAESKQ